MISLLLRISPHSLQGTAIETHSHRPSLIVSCVAYDTQVAPALVGQTGAALRAAASQDLAAVGGSHSLAEAMHLFPMNLLRLICSLQNSTSFLAQTAELPSHRFLGSPPRPDEPVCVNPFTIYYSGFRFICQALRQTFLRNFRLFFFFHRFSTAVLGRLHGFFVGF